jgi:hypothetical protein
MLWTFRKPWHWPATATGRRLDTVSRRRPRRDSFDVVTPTPREAREAEIAKRRRGYFLFMLPCIALVLFGFFVPAPVPVRVVALAIAAVLPPLAAISGNARPPT